MRDRSFRDALLNGLRRRPHRIPCRYLYDGPGSELFERITTLDGYYLTRAETALLAQAAEAVAAMLGPGARVIEPGAGSMRKSRVLLEALDRPSVFVPVDVTEGVVENASQLKRDMPGLSVTPVLADFTHRFHLPPMTGEGPIVVFFPGSTIGNLAPVHAVHLMSRLARLAGCGGWVLIGVDPVREPHRLKAAYDDCQGITAAFMRNVLVRANRECSTSFDAAGFDHRVHWNAAESRVEHRLVCRRKQTVRLGKRQFPFRRGESIHIEDCYKYPPKTFHALAIRAGLRPTVTWLHADGLFSMHLLRPDPFPRGMNLSRPYVEAAIGSLGTQTVTVVP